VCNCKHSPSPHTVYTRDAPLARLTRVATRNTFRHTQVENSRQPSQRPKRKGHDAKRSAEVARAAADLLHCRTQGQTHSHQHQYSSPPTPFRALRASSRQAGSTQHCTRVLYTPCRHTAWPHPHHRPRLPSACGSHKRTVEESIAAPTAQRSVLAMAAAPSVPSLTPPRRSSLEALATRHLPSATS